MAGDSARECCGNSSKTLTNGVVHLPKEYTADLVLAGVPLEECGEEEPQEAQKTKGSQGQVHDRAMDLVAKKIDQESW